MFYFKNIVFFILINFSSSILLGQNLPSAITFNNGDTFKGLSKIKKNQKILFRLDEHSLPDEYGPEDITKIVFYERSEQRTFEYVQIRATKKKNKFLLMENIESGEITLYQHYKTKKKISDNGGFWNPNEQFPQHNRTLETVYVVKRYLKMKDNDIALSLNDADTIKSVLMKCFGHCPTVLDELEIVGYEESNLDDLIWQYNRDCTEKED